MEPMSKKLLTEVEGWMAAGMKPDAVSAKLVRDHKCSPTQVKRYLELAKVKTVEAPRDLTTQEKLKPRDTKDFQNFQQNKVREETSQINQGLTKVPDAPKENPWGYNAPPAMKSRRAQVIGVKKSDILK